MSAAKRTLVRGKQVTKKTAKKVAKKTRVSAVSTSSRVTKRARKTATKSASKRNTVSVTKKTTKKVVKKIVKRAVKRSMTMDPQSVRAARYGGHANTIPTNPKAPGRLLGRSITLSFVGVSGLSHSVDTVVIGIARLGGVAIMVIGLALTWNLYNQLVTSTPPPSAATVISATAQHSVPTISVTSPQPVEGLTTVVVSAAVAKTVVLELESATGSMYVLGDAEQKSDTTWELSFDTDIFTNGDYTLHAYILPNGTDVADTATVPLTIANQVPVVTEATPATTNTSSEDMVMAPTTTMPVLDVPTVTLIAPVNDDVVRVIGTATPEQIIEVLLLRENIRATTTVQDNGWWSFTLPTPRVDSHYELYAQASPTMLSGPLDFDVISGRLLTKQSMGKTQLSMVSGNDTSRESVLWYLLAAVTTVAVGLVVLLIGHHLHHQRRQSVATLDPH